MKVPTNNTVSSVVNLLIVPDDFQKAKFARESQWVSVLMCKLNVENKQAKYGANRPLSLLLTALIPVFRDLY